MKLFCDRKWQNNFLQKMNNFKMKNQKIDGKILSIKELLFFK